MSSNPSRSYYYTSNEPSTSRNSHERLPSLRSVLGAQLDLPVQSGSRSGSYDLREMSRALPSHSASSPSDHRASRSGSGHGTYSDRDRDRDRTRDYRDQRAHAFPPSANPVATSTARGGHGHSHSSGLSNDFQDRHVAQRYADPAYTSSSYSDPPSMDRGHGNKKYGCTWPGCEKRFERQNALDTHMNIHTDQKPYACPVANCGKMFNVRSNMRRHLLTHKDYHGDEDEDRPVSSRSSKGYCYTGY